jgi:hypothetical protein
MYVMAWVMAKGTLRRILGVDMVYKEEKQEKEQGFTVHWVAR